MLFFGEDCISLYGKDKQFLVAIPYEDIVDVCSTGSVVHFITMTNIDKQRQFVTESPIQALKLCREAAIHLRRHHWIHHRRIIFNHLPTV